MRPLVFGLFLLVPACAASETVPMSDTGAMDSAFDPESGPGSDAATDTSLADTTIADTATGSDTTMPDTTQPDTTTPDTTVADTARPDTTPIDTGFDSGFKSTDHVHIYISNTCRVTVSPTSFTVPAGETLKLSYHNHSVDYRADVWMMYGGGYLALERGATWNETYTHCFGPSPSVGYADINIEGGPTSGCPGARLNITCQ